MVCSACGRKVRGRPAKNGVCPQCRKLQEAEKRKVTETLPDGNSMVMPEREMHLESIADDAVGN